MTPIHEHLNESTMQRFLSHAFPEPNTGCWLWAGTADRHGYGKFQIARFTLFAHRVALTHKLGRDLRGLALHSCDTPLCVNPDHLREGTPSDNTRDMVARGRQGVGYKMPRATGSLNHEAKLAEADVLAIRAMAGSVSSRELARRYGVGRTTISHVVHRENWKHI